MSNVLNAVSVLAKLGNVGGKVMTDNKIDLADLVVLPEVAMLFPLISTVKWGEIVVEAKALTVAQADAVVAQFKADFNIPQDDLETTIETVIEKIEKVSILAIQVVETVKDLVACFKKPA